MRGLLVAVALVILLVALGFAYVSWDRVVVPPPPPITEVTDTLEAKNLGLAQLENLEYADAIATLREVAKRVPDEPFGPLNLAIAGSLALDAFDPDRDAANFDLAKDAAEQAQAMLTQFEQEAALAAYLRGSKERRLGNHEAAYAAFLDAAHAEDASERSSSRASAAYWYAAYETARDEQLPVSDQERFSLLISSLNAAPSNLFLLTEALPLALEVSADDLPRLIDSAKNEVAGLRAGMIKRLGTRGDPVALLEQAATAVQSDDKAIANRNLQLFSRIIRPDSRARSDQRLVLPNLLEFAKLDFSSQFYDKYSPAEPTAAVAIVLEGESYDRPPEVDGETRSAVVGDVDLDGEVEVFSAVYDESNDQTVLAPVAVRDEGNVEAGDVPAIPLITLEGDFREFQFVDIDNDFRSSSAGVNPAAGNAPCRTTDLDLIAAGRSGLALVRNELDADGLRWQRLDPGPFAELKNVDTFVAVDAEADGDLDLMISGEDGVSLFLNRGDGTFEPTDEVVVGDAEAGRLRRMVAVDLDRDVDTDVVILRDADPPLAYFENLRHGRFHLRMIDRSLGPGAKPSDLAILDADENGSWDIAVTSESRAQLLRTITPQPGRWSVTDVDDVPLAGSVVPADLDSDGRIDFVMSDGRIAVATPTHPWFDVQEDVQQAPSEQAVVSQHAVDLNNDGLLDVVGMDGGQTRVAVNRTDTPHKHLKLTLLAEQISTGQSDASGRVNSYGIGSTVEVRAADRMISRVVNGVVTHAGLGTAAAADSVRVVWTNGIPGHIVQPQANQYLCEQQTLKGSCPYLYAWDGEKFAFVTDLLWAAPIGLQFADGVQAVPREWEYLAVPGELVQPRGDRYELRVTEELWEAAYFDHLKLTAVDHPAGTELVTNEKVGPPEIAAHRLYIVDETIPPSSAYVIYRDSSKRDITGVVAEVDGEFAKPHRVKHRQGLVEQHQVEITFPPFSKSEAAGPQTLLLTGWVRPTDTSINVALSHDERLASPLPPRLLARNETGEWSVAREFMGFPGGKTKTIAVDVTGLLQTEDPALRIETSMEFAWDRIALLSGPADGSRIDGEGPKNTVTQTDCTLVSARLQHRGFSARIPEMGGHPETYDYSDVSTEPRWPMMEGRFTRYGPVDKLLGAADDRLVVMGSGDEIVLSFAALPPPKAGWTRSFVLHSVGWDKDADLNTIYGDSSEPYPMLGVTQYPSVHGFENRADSDWQTRRFVPVQ